MATICKNAQRKKLSLKIGLGGASGSQALFIHLGTLTLDQVGLSTVTYTMKPASHLPV